MADSAAVTVPPMADRVSWRYIGAKTRHTLEKRAAWYRAMERSVGSTVRSALGVFWSLTVG